MAHAQRLGRSRRPLDLMALKFIRMLIASYLVLIGLGAIEGFDPAALLKVYLSETTATTVGSAAVIACATLLFFGLFLRSTCLILAIILLSSSIFGNFFVSEAGSTDALWRDLLVVCGLLLSYCTLSERDIRRQSCFTFRRRTKLPPTHGKVVPKRVTRQSPGLHREKATSAAVTSLADFRRNGSADAAQRVSGQSAVKAAATVNSAPDWDREVANIFA